MAKFMVRLARDRTEYASVEVEAENELEAEDAAQDWIDNGNPIDWEPGETTCSPQVLDDEIEVVSEGSLESEDLPDGEPRWCESNECEREGCHRCNPVQGCEDHDKCQEPDRYEDES